MCHRVGVTLERADHGGESVEIRAFRGTRRYVRLPRPRRSASGRFERILAAGERNGLALLATLDRRGPHELDKRRARARWRPEATSLRISGELPDLDDDLTEIAEVARWCARASEGSWLRIEGRDGPGRADQANLGVRSLKWSVGVGADGSTPPATSWIESDHPGGRSSSGVAAS